MPAKQHRKHLAVSIAALGIAALLQGCASSGGANVAEGLSAKGPYRYDSKHNFIKNRMARNSDGTINVVVEIPAGTSAKWAVSPDGNSLLRDFTGETPRVIDYLPYPGNYGMIPRTLLRSEDGGDGSALDVMVLGPAVPRGSTVRARAIGVIRIIDRGEQDDKVLAVMQGPTMKGIYDVESLRLRYPGAAEIIGTWWANAHGKHSKADVLGTGSRGVASSIIDFAVESYKTDELQHR
jgi:inorganic pyrophosphatase